MDFVILFHFRVQIRFIFESVQGPMNCCLNYSKYVPDFHLKIPDKKRAVNKIIFFFLFNTNNIITKKIRKDAQQWRTLFRKITNEKNEPRQKKTLMNLEDSEGYVFHAPLLAVDVLFSAHLIIGCIIDEIYVPDIQVLLECWFIDIESTRLETKASLRL